MRKIFVLLVIGLVWFGLAECWDWIRHREPVPVSYDATPNDDMPKHVTLQGIRLSFFDQIVVKGLAERSVYIAVKSSRNSSSETIRILLQTDDAALVESASNFTGGSLEKVIKDAGGLAKKTEITGRIQTMEPSEKVRKKMRKLIPNLSEDFLVIKEGDRPSIMKGLYMLCFAFGLVVLGVKMSSSKEPVQPPELPVPPKLT